MASQLIQFQPGMSIPEFVRCFGTEAQCTEALMKSRWPNGYYCPRCGQSEHYVAGHGARKLFQCNGCRYQSSLTPGSLMEHTKLPLTTWFLAIYLISQAKTGLSALALKRQLGVSYPTAWLMQQKIGHAMAQREATHQLSGSVQLDDAYLGGERAGGKPGCGSENKVPFVAAVSLNASGGPQYIKLKVVAGFTLEAIGQWAKASLAPGAFVLSDGLACFSAVTSAGCVHMPVVVGDRKPRDLPQFQWVNTTLGNLKTSLSGAFRTLKHNEYASTYLAAFAYRCNRRFDLVGLDVVDVTTCRPRPERVIRGQVEGAF